MDDVNSRIKKLNSYKKTNFYIVLINILYFIYLTIQSVFMVNSEAQWIITAYLFINLMVCTFLTFKHVKVQPNIDFAHQPEKYYEMQIDRTIISNDLAPIFFYLPIFFSTLSIWAIDWLHDRTTGVLDYVILSFFLLPTFFAYFRMRKLLRREYKKIHGMDFLSFLYF